MMELLVRLLFRVRVITPLWLTPDLYFDDTSVFGRGPRSFKVCTVEVEKATVN